MSIKAEATAVDQELGTFVAVVSGWSADREKDEIDRHAFDETVQLWRRSGKRLPMRFEHGTVVVGSLDPHSMNPTDEGLVASGEVDRETDEGKQVWKMIKAGSIGFSIGFVGDSVSREDGSQLWVSIDPLEISATSVPTHPVTRALSLEVHRPRRRHLRPRPRPPVQTRRPHAAREQRARGTDPHPL